MCQGHKHYYSPSFLLIPLIYWLIQASQDGTRTPGSPNSLWICLCIKEIHIGAHSLLYVMYVDCLLAGEAAIYPWTLPEMPTSHKKIA